MNNGGNDGGTYLGVLAVSALGSAGLATLGVYELWDTLSIWAALLGAVEGLLIGHVLAKPAGGAS